MFSVIYLPPLRERPEDIPLLVRKFVREFALRTIVPSAEFLRTRCSCSCQYQWPGNVRELSNLVESMVVLAPGREIEASDIPREIRDGGGGRVFFQCHSGRCFAARWERLARAGVHCTELVELKLQVEELRARMQSASAERVRSMLRSRTGSRGVMPGTYDYRQCERATRIQYFPEPPVGAIEPPNQVWDRERLRLRRE
jgi:DNA-binding NtrC family response regulator